MPSARRGPAVPHGPAGRIRAIAQQACAPAPPAPSASAAAASALKILDGINVIDLSTVIAAPACASTMADFGATVTKIEPPGGDSWRSSGAAGAMFQQDNRGKRSVCLDLTKPEGYEVFLKMLETTDVLITNMRGKALQKLNCDYETLSALKPCLIFAMLTTHGLEGPDVDLPGYDIGVRYWGVLGAYGAISTEES